MTLLNTNKNQSRLNGPIEKSYSRISELTKKTSLDCSATLNKTLKSFDLETSKLCHEKFKLWPYFIRSSLMVRQKQKQNWRFLLSLTVLSSSYLMVWQKQICPLCRLLAKSLGLVVADTRRCKTMRKWCNFWYNETLRILVLCSRGRYVQ